MKGSFDQALQQTNPLQDCFQPHTQKATSTYLFPSDLNPPMTDITEELLKRSQSEANPFSVSRALQHCVHVRVCV